MSKESRLRASIRRQFPDLPQDQIDYMVQIHEVSQDRSTMLLELYVKDVWFLLSVLQFAAMNAGLQPGMVQTIKEEGDHLARVLLEFHPNLRDLIEKGWDPRLAFEANGVQRQDRPDYISSLIGDPGQRWLVHQADLAKRQGYPPPLPHADDDEPDTPSVPVITMTEDELPPTIRDAFRAAKAAMDAAIKHGIIQGQPDDESDPPGDDKPEGA